MTTLDGKVVWITGAGSGIGEATAMTLATAGAHVVVTGRRREPLEAVAERIHASGGMVLVAPGDVSKSGPVNAIAKSVFDWQGRLDIVVNNAGMNIRARRWHELTPEAIDQVLSTNLNAAFYCSAAAIKLMRAQRDGLLIHISSWAGRFLSNLAGAGYTSAKGALIDMSHTINLEEHGSGIRSTVIMPAEIATPILDSRPNPPAAEERAKILKPADLAELILFVAQRPKSVCLNEIVISPTDNRVFGIT
jgi:NADP-dependent 3-hydroxy acid dehydrogenase YdfG